MARSSFLRALAFALLAAALWLPVWIAGVYGYEATLADYLLMLAPISLLLTAAELRGGVRAALASGVVALVLLLCVSHVESALVGVVVLLALGRAVREGPRPLARVLLLEVGLGVLSFAAFAAFWDGRLLGDALAVWAFWLVQSGAALIVHTPALRDEPGVDPFDAARSAAERLMSQ